MLFNSTKRKNNLKRIWYKKNYIKKRNFQKFIKFKNKKYSRIYWWKPTLRKVQHSLKKVLNILKKQKVFKIKLKHLRYKKKKRKRRLKFHQWKKKRKRQRRFINFVKLKKVKRRKRFSEILGFNQRNFMKSFFKIRLIPVFSNLQVEKLVETDKKVQKDEMLDFIRKINKNLNKKKKRKFVLNVRRKIRRKKSRKFKKKSLRLKKKIRKLKKNNKKIIIFSKTSRYVRRLRFKRKYARLLKIKFNRKRKFILFLKLKKRRRRFTKKSSKRFFLRRRKVYRRRFGQMGIKKKKKNKKFTYKRKWNKIVTVRKEFMYLWKDKKRKGNKNFNLIFFKKIIKVHKKFKQRRTKSWRRRRLLLKIRSAGIGLLMKLFYRFTIKKKIKLRLKNKLRKKIKLRNLKKKIKINIKKLKKRFSSFKKKKKKYFYANRRKTKWKARKVFKLLKSSVILKKKKIKQKSIKRNDLMKAKNKFELRLLLYFFRQRKRKIKKRRYNLLYKFKFHKRKKKERKFYLIKFPKKFRLIRFLKYANVKSINQVEFFRWKKNLIIKDKMSYSRKFFVIKFKKSLKKRKLKKKKTRKIIRNFVFHKYKILFRKLRFSWNFLLKRKLKYSELLTKKIFLKKEKILFKAKYDHQRKKRKRESWAKTKQRLRYERKIKYRRKRKYLVKLKSKKLLKIKNKVLEKDPTLNKKFSMKRLKRVFYKKAKVYFQKKKKHLKNSIFIRRKKKKRKLIFYIFKTKKWNIQLNNKTSRTFRNKRRTKKYGRQVKKNRIFYYVQNINNGKIRRRRRNVFRLREALKKFIRKITRGLPNNFKNYFSNPNKKEKNKSLEHFSNNFINNINIIIYRVGIFPSLSLSIEAVKQNWICRNFETPNIRENIMNIGDNITLAPSFNVFSNYLWTKRVFIEQMYTMDCSKQEFLFSKKPFLFIFVKIKQKNLITNNAPKDWIKLSLLKNLKLIP